MLKSLFLKMQARPSQVVNEPIAARVLLALYLNSDEEGLESRATDEALALAAGLTTGEVGAALRHLIEAGWIRALDLPPWHPRRGRSLVLMDHEAAQWYVSETLGVPGRRPTGAEGSRRRS